MEVLRERFAALFEGEYATGIQPDEVNWKAGRDREDLTRQICNGWRADDLVAAQVLSERTGRLAAQLGGYRGTRMLQDNCLWKPPGARSLGMHQDGSYAGYLVPPEMITCWVALDDTRAQGGTIEYVRGSHQLAQGPAVARRVPRARGLAGAGPRRRARRRRARARAGGGQGRRLHLPPLAHLSRLGTERGRDPSPGARVAPRAGGDALPPGAWT